MTASLLTEIIFYPVCKKRSVSQDAAAFLSFFILFRTLYTFIPRMALRFLPNALRRSMIVISDFVGPKPVGSGQFRPYHRNKPSGQAIFALIFPRTLALASFAPSVSANPPSLRHAASASETFSYSAAHPPTTDASSG